MALETGNYIGDLVITNPTSSDQKSAGDDHLRLIKTALKTSFAGFTGSIILTGSDTGGVNNYALTPTPALPAYVAGMMVLFNPSATNTTTSTINISALGAKTIKTVDGAALNAGDFVTGVYHLLIYDGTDFRLIGLTKNYADNLSFSSSLPSQAGNGGKYITTDGTVASWADPFFSAALTGAPTAPTAVPATDSIQIATTAFVKSQAYATLLSPTFTGTPIAPTATADITTGQIINAAWYNGQKGTALPIINGTAAAGTSKTWSPIDHVHPTDTSRAATASPTFTGTPAAPTASVNTNTTQLATTAFVLAQAASAAEVTTATSTTKFVAPGTMIRHKGTAKVWAKADTAGSLLAGYNISSVTDVGIGEVTFNYAITLGALYCAVGFFGNGVTAALTIYASASSTTSFSMRLYDGTSFVDPASWFLTVHEGS